MAQPEQTRPASARDGLDALRERIDRVDRAILARLNERAELVRAVGQLKRDGGDPVYEPAREHRIVASLTQQNSGPFPDAGLSPVYREIISATRSLEDPVRIAYMGPEGTFSHQAALRKFGALARLAEVPTIRDVFAAVETGRAELGVVPVENTTEGVVTQTLDCLAEFELGICAEAMLRVSLDLLSRSGRLEDVREVASHPQPLAQSRRWLTQHLPDVGCVQTPSTAAAAKLAAERGDVAAIASTTAGEVHGLTAIERGIEDRRDNTTRFLVLGREGAPPSGRDLTSAVFTIRKDQPGGLHRLIEPMARRGVNLTSIHLRPINGKPWEYLFFIDLEGHRSEPSLAAALEDAGLIAHSARILGSYPRAGEGD